ncbi:MAG: hypothetical protein J0I41_22855 [Filimonas sp.]|nr:hypothetical protein [Filimonas sp.]
MTDLLFSTTKACLIAGFYPILIFLLHPTRKLAALACFILFISLAIIFHSRTAIGTIIIVTGLWLNIKLDRKVLAIVALLAVVLVLVNFDSCFGRLFIWYNIFCHIGEIPLTGKGLYMFQSTYADWQAGYFATHTSYNKAYFIADSPMFAYNEWLQVYVEFGVGAVILLTVLVFLNLKLMNNVKGIFKGFVVSNLVIFAFCLVSFPLHQNYTLSLFLINQLIIFTYFLTKVWHKQIAFVCILLIFGGIIYFQLNKVKYVKQWQMASLAPLSERRAILESCFPHLYHDSYFLDNYISVLMMQKDFVTAGNILHNYKVYMNQYRYYTMSGDRYSSMREYNSAIVEYSKAQLIIPNRFEPLYKTMIIHLMNKNILASQQIAAVIIKMPVKIPSAQIEMMKKDAVQVEAGKLPSMFN